MKYVIGENRLNRVIHEYLDEMFPEDQVELEHPLEYDDATGEVVADKCRIKFSFKDDDDDDTVFYYYKRCFWNGTNRYIEKFNPPYLDIEIPFRQQLRGLFGDHLDESFKEWFTNRYKLPLNKIG